MYYATKIIDIRNPLKTDADSIQRIDEVMERALSICNLSFTKPMACMDLIRLMSPTINKQHYAIFDGVATQLPDWQVEHRPTMLDTSTWEIASKIEQLLYSVRKYAIFMTSSYTDPNSLNWYVIVPKDNKLYIVMKVTNASAISHKYDIEIDHSLMNELSKHITAAAVMYAAPRAVMNRFKSSFFTEELTVEA